MWKWFHILQWTMAISYLVKWIFCKCLLRQFDILCVFILKCLRWFLVFCGRLPIFVSGSIRLSKFLYTLVVVSWNLDSLIFNALLVTTISGHCWLTHPFCWLSPMLTTLLIKSWIELKCLWASSLRSLISSSCPTFTSILPP